MPSYLNKPEEIISGLLDYLDEKKSIGLLPEITRVLEKESSKIKEKDEIIITSAVKLTDTQLQNIKNHIFKRFNKELPVTNKIDSNLIGGFTIKVNDWILDSSIVNEINHFRRQLLE